MGQGEQKVPSKVSEYFPAGQVDVAEIAPSGQYVPGVGKHEPWHPAVAAPVVFAYVPAGQGIPGVADPATQYRPIGQSPEHAALASPVALPKVPAGPAQGYDTRKTHQPTRPRVRDSTMTCSRRFYQTVLKLQI